MGVSCTNKQQPETGRRHTCSWQHATMVDTYRTARLAYEQEREAACNGWATETAQYPPGPTFRDHLIANRGAGRRDADPFPIAS